jgi:D-glycerate 3-kinase
MDYKAVGLSIDDIYKTYDDRQRLVQADPRLRWRGTPGTHDIDLALAAITHIRSAAAGEAVALPQFDKSLHGGEGDRVDPVWVQDVDILLFEGWFLGARPIDPAQFDRAPAPITTDYRLSKQWRKDAEHQMKAQGKTGMDDATIDNFVEYFWRALHPELFIPPLKRDADHVNLVVEIGSDRCPVAIYSPTLAII